MEKHDIENWRARVIEDSAGDDVDGDEVLDLLRVSTMPPPAVVVGSDDDFGPFVPGEVVAQAERVSRRDSVMYLPSPRRDRHVMAWIGVAAVAAMFLAGGLALAKLRGGAVQTRPQAAEMPVAQCAVSPAPAVELATVEPAAVEPAEVGSAAVEPAVSVAADAWTPRRAQATSNVSSVSSVSDAPAVTVDIPENPYGEETSPPAAAVAVSPPAAKPRSAIDDLIDSAFSQPVASAIAAAPGTNDLPEHGVAALPEKPSRDAVRRAMESVAGQVRQCGGNAGEQVVVEAVVKGATGRVANAQSVDKQHGGTSIGLCAARAVRVAKLPRFAAEAVTVRYPFDL